MKKLLAFVALLAICTCADAAIVRGGRILRRPARTSVSTSTSAAIKTSEAGADRWKFWNDRNPKGLRQ